MNELSLTLSQKLVSLGLSALVQATIILAVGLLAGRITQKRGPAWQSLVYRATLATTAVALIVTLLAGGRIPERTRLSNRVTTAISRPDRFVTVVYEPVTIVSVGGGKSAIPETGEQTPAPPPPTPPVRQRWTPPANWPWILAGYLWLAGALVVGFRAAVGALSLGFLQRSSQDICAGKTQEIAQELSRRLNMPRPALRAHRKVKSPFLAGIIKPGIYLPEDYAQQYDASTLRAILSHELAHAVRKDCLWLPLQQALGGVLWFHPLFHVLSNKLAQAAEEACDAIVVTLDCPAPEYAASLLALAERSHKHTEPVLALGVTPIRSSVGKRIRLILDRSHQAVIRIPRWGRAVAGAAAVTLAGLAIALFCPAQAGWRMAAQADSKGIILPVAWTPDKDYASHFHLAREHHWSVAPVRGVVRVSRPADFEKTLPPAIPANDLALMKACRDDWDAPIPPALAYSFTPKDAPIGLREKIEKVLIAHPRYFYAEYRLAVWYGCHHNMDQYRLWRDRALSDAPAILAGRVQYSDGRPVVGMAVAPIYEYMTTDSNLDIGDPHFDPHNYALTDEDGCYYVPVYRAVYDFMTDATDNEHDPVYAAVAKSNVMNQLDLRRFVIDGKVGLIPPIGVQPFISFTAPAGAVKTSAHSPMHITDTGLTISWKPVPRATHYIYNVYELIPRNGRFDIVRVYPSADKSDNFGSIRTTNTSVILDFLDPKVAYCKGHVYRFGVAAVCGDENLSMSHQFYFAPERALAPMAVTKDNIEAAMPTMHVQAISEAEGKLVVKGTMSGVEDYDTKVMSVRQLFDMRIVRPEPPDISKPWYAIGSRPKTLSNQPFTLVFANKAKPAQ